VTWSWVQLFRHLWRAWRRRRHSPTTSPSLR